MKTDVRPDTGLHEQVDGVCHLVCWCQLDANGLPVLIPFVALCGWTLGEDAEHVEDADKVCSMCHLEERCPACGGPGLARIR